MTEKIVLLDKAVVKGKFPNRGFSVPVDCPAHGVLEGIGLAQYMQRVGWGCVVKGLDQTNEYTALGHHLLVRSGHPCYGELRKYGKDASDDTRKPGDLLWPFPRGVEPLAVIAPLYTEACKRKLFDFLLDREFSPYKEVLKDSMLANGKTLVITNVDIDPTAIVNLLMTIKNICDNNRADSYDYYLSEGLSEHKASFASMITVMNTIQGSKKMFLMVPDYTLGWDTSFNNWKKSKLVPMKPKTFREGEDYNRRNLHDVFKGEGRTFKELRDFITGNLNHVGGTYEPKEVVKLVKRFFEPV